MRTHLPVVLAALVAMAVGCSASDNSSNSPTSISDGGSDMGKGTVDATTGDAMMPSPDEGAPGPLGYAPCDTATRVGSLEITLDDGFTSVQGQIYNGINPGHVPMVTASEGPCRFLRPKTLICEPRCEVGTTCGDQGQCQAQPEALSIGTITIDGLTDAVEMTAGPPVFYYSHRGQLTHPAFNPGEAISMHATGVDSIEGFSLRGRGLEPLEIQETPLALKVGVPSTLRWTAPSSTSTTMVHLVLSIANHGGTPGQIDCEVADTGEFTFPLALTDALLALGYSGFPAVWLTRRTATSVDNELGCIQFVVQSNAGLDITIPGLTSCSDDTDCPDGQTCGPDLACSETN